METSRSFRNFELHLVFGLYLFVHALNFDAGRGKQLLKDFFKICILEPRKGERCRHNSSSEMGTREDAP
jgi:hypothetical protein